MKQEDVSTAAPITESLALSEFAEFCFSFFLMERKVANVDKKDVFLQREGETETTYTHTHFVLPKMAVCVFKPTHL